jgi:hypothetical protein
VRVPHVARDPAELRAERGRGLIQRVRQLEKGMSKITHHERRAYPIWCAYVACQTLKRVPAGARCMLPVSRLRFGGPGSSKSSRKR